MTTTDQALSVVQHLAGLASMFPAPVGKWIGAGLELIAEAIRICEGKDDADPAVVLAVLKDQLRGGVTAAWQRALDDGG